MEKKITKVQSKLELSSTDKIEVLKSFIEENRRQVEWIKNLDFKATEYCIISTLVLIGWVVTNGLGYVSESLIKKAFLILPLMALFILARNHMRHFKLNRQWQKAAIALRLHEASEYSDEAIVAIENHEATFHLGRTFYAIPILATAFLAFYTIGNVYSHVKDEIKIGIGDCIISETGKGEAGIFKVVGQGSNELLTFSHFFVNGKLTLGKDYNRIEKIKVDQEYWKVECPEVKKAFSPQEYLSATEKIVDLTIDTTLKPTESLKGK